MALSLALTLVGNLVVALFILVCTALVLIILLQKGRGGGIGAAFGGGGAGSLLGTKTGDFLTWVTISLVAFFLVLAVLMGKFMRPSGLSPELSVPVSTAPVLPEGTEPIGTEPLTPDTEVVEQPADAATGVVEEATPPAESPAGNVTEPPVEGDVAPTPEPSN